MFEGRDPRQYEQVSYTQGDEVKWNPLSVGSLVYVVGEMTGTQTYGACGQMTGKIEFELDRGTVCGGAEIHGWVTGTLKITNVELLLDGGSLGSASLSGPPRIDIPSTTPVSTWRVAVNLDAITRGEHVLRASEPTAAETAGSSPASASSSRSGIELRSARRRAHSPLDSRGSTPRDSTIAIASAAARGSLASVTGRPTTM